MSSLGKLSSKKMPKPNNIVTVPTGSEDDFFRWWCVFLRPFINLTNREIDVITSFLKMRLELSKHITDSTILDSVLMSEETKRKVVKECNLTAQHFYVLMSNLKKNKVIINDTLNPRLIPNIRKDDNGCFQLLVLFKQKNGGKKE